MTGAGMRKRKGDYGGEKKERKDDILK